MEIQEIEILYKKPKIHHEASVNSPDVAFQMFLKFWDKQINYRESVYVAYLDRKSQVKYVQQHSTGSTSACIVDVKQIFATALKTASESIIVAHNHPSGNLNASVADQRVYDRLKTAGTTLDINVTDFLIISESGYNSLRQ